MINDFLKKLSSGQKTETPEDDARLAMTALLVRVAKANWDYAAVEIDRIDAILCQRYGLDRAAAVELRLEAEVVEADANDTVQFTRSIKDAVVYEDRSSVMEALWDLVLADGVRDSEEDAVLRLIAPLLGISDRESAIARQRVEARLT